MRCRSSSFSCVRDRQVGLVLDVGRPAAVLRLAERLERPPVLAGVEVAEAILVVGWTILKSEFTSDPVSLVVLKRHTKLWAV